MSADIVTGWNSSHLESIRRASTSPPKASRQMAILQLAIHDTIQSFNQVYRPYYVNQAAPAGASLEAAIAAAAKTVLDNFYSPTATDAPTINAVAVTTASYNLIYDNIPNGTAKTAGITWGEQVGQAYLSLRANDGASTAQFVETFPNTPGVWQPTPPANANPVLPGWGSVRPFGMITGDQFRPHQPPRLDSNAYTVEFNVTKEQGAKTSLSRNTRQTECALFWADGGGTETPPGHWMRIAAETAEARALTVNESGRLLALIGMCVADAGISAWDAKYTYDYWRPITAIRGAATDGNPDTAADNAWEPLIVTPPFPEYTSGHSTFSRSAASLLEKFFAANPVTSLTVTSDFRFSGGNGSIFNPSRADGSTLAPITYSSFSAAADDAGISRIFGGIHFESGNIAAQVSGYGVANQAWKYFLQPKTAANSEFCSISYQNGTPTMQFAVTSAGSYTVYVSTDLAMWTPLVTKASDGLFFNFVDTSATGTQRFYRIKSADAAPAN